jgi:hypothetical protein
MWFFEFFCIIQLKGIECGFTSAVNLYFFRLSSTFSTSRAVKNPNLRADLNPEYNCLPIYTELLTQCKKNDYFYFETCQNCQSFLYFNLQGFKFFRLLSTFCTDRAVKNPNLRVDLNPESDCSLIYTE